MVLLSEMDPSFRLLSGEVDNRKYLDYLDSLNQLEPEEFTDPPTAYEVALATFVEARISEAVMAKELHAWPDNRPWNRQPWWMLEIWKAFWAGQAKGFEESMAH